MQTFTVWFSQGGGTDLIFVSGVPGASAAERIANALMQEDFVRFAWVEEG